MQKMFPAIVSKLIKLSRQVVLPKKEHEEITQVDGKFVYTYQALFDKKEDAEKFQNLCNKVAF